MKLFENKPQKTTQIVTLNAVMFVNSLRNTYIKNIINSSIVIPESAGIRLLLKKYKIDSFVIRGVDLIKNIIRYSIDNKKSIFFVGGVINVSKRLHTIYGDKLSMKATHGFFINESEVIESINEFEPYFLLVGMGFPKQEVFIYKNLEKIKPCYAIGCGGSLDVITGKVLEAPKIFIKTNTEFLFRFLIQPWRFKNLKNILKFLYILTR
ncbi:MAG: WecB/TagA/CpsF family glycosyltransferase [bacterium]|nr:WecB/TagA/CpsF family glycosyltransferase [bacterium]